MKKYICCILLVTIWCLPLVIPVKLCENQSFKKEELPKIADILIERINVDLPPKGSPFPTIKGPKPHENVCIVGAGPAGIHMALSLKEKGYRNIRIFEKTGRVGGKSYDIQLGGFYRAQGTIFLSADYFDNLVKLAKKYDVGGLHEFPSPGVCKIIVSSLILIVFYVDLELLLRKLLKFKAQTNISFLGMGQEFSKT